MRMWISACRRWPSRHTSKVLPLPFLITCVDMCHVCVGRVWSRSGMYFWCCYSHLLRNQRAIANPSASWAWEQATKLPYKPAITCYRRRIVLEWFAFRQWPGSDPRNFWSGERILFFRYVIGCTFTAILAMDTWRYPQGDGRANTANSTA